MIKIINDFLDEKTINEIQYILTHQNFNWFFGKQTGGTDAVYEKNVKDTYQFTHFFYGNNNVMSPHFNSIQKILSSLIKKENIKIKKIERIKANFTTNITGYKKDNFQPIHTDQLEDNYFSFLYYVDDFDGHTYFFNEKQKIIKKIKPKKGTGVLFNSNISHAASNPIKSNYRIVINFLFEI